MIFSFILEEAADNGGKEEDKEGNDVSSNLSGTSASRAVLAARAKAALANFAGTSSKTQSTESKSSPWNFY